MNVKEAIKNGRKVCKILWHGNVSGKFRNDSGKEISYHGVRVLLGTVLPNDFNTYSSIKLVKATDNYMACDGAFITPYFDEYQRLDNDEEYDDD